MLADVVGPELSEGLYALDVTHGKGFSGDLGFRSVMRNENRNRTCPNDRLGHAPEHNPLQTSLSVGPHDHEIVLSVLRVMIDALSRSADICEHIDLH